LQKALREQAFGVCKRGKNLEVIQPWAHQFAWVQTVFLQLGHVLIMLSNELGRFKFTARHQVFWPLVRTMTYRTQRVDFQWAEFQVVALLGVNNRLQIINSTAQEYALN